MNEKEILAKLFQAFGEGTKGYTSVDEAIEDISRQMREEYAEGYNNCNYNQVMG